MTREEAYRLAMRACEKTWNKKTCKQIKEALEQEPCGERLYYHPEEKKYEAYNWAIRSLEAWDKIQTDISQYIENVYDKIQDGGDPYDRGRHDGAIDCYSRIKAELDMLEVENEKI